MLITASHFLNVSAEAQLHYNLRLVKMYWNTWSQRLHHKWREEDRLAAAAQLTVRSTQRRALLQWSTCILDRETGLKSKPDDVGFLSFSR